MPRFIPASQTYGGSPIGNTYLNQWVACRRKWFYRYLFPSLTWVLRGEGAPDLLGISPTHTKPALVKGSTFHIFMETWLRSGCRDGADTGQYDLDRALSAAEAHHTARKFEYLDETKWAEDWSSLREMGIRYHETYGPQGTAPDYPNLRVVCDGNGEPLVERDYAVPLTDGHYYTTRLDAIVEHLGYLKVLEHKTSVASWVGRRIRSARMDTQFTSELYALHYHFPDEKLFGVLLNVAVKDRSGNSKWSVAERETINRVPADYEAFKADCVSILEQIDHAVGVFKQQLERGCDWQQAALGLFGEDGRRNDHCFSYNDECEFIDLCRMRGMERQYLQSMRQRTPVEVKEDREFTL